MRRAWLHLPARSSAVLLTACKLALGAALLRTSSRRDRKTTDDRSAAFLQEDLGALSMSVTEMSGGWFVPAVADAGRTSHPSPTEKDSATVPCAGPILEPGTADGTLDLLAGLGIALGYEIQAATALGNDGLADTIGLLLAGVLDTAEVITEDMR